MPCRVELVKVSVFTDVLVDQLAGPDVDWMVGLELETIPTNNVVLRSQKSIPSCHLSRMYSYFCGPRIFFR